MTPWKHRKAASWLAAFAMAALAVPAYAPTPAWWSQSGTQIIDDGPNVPHDTASNYAPANLGQLKHVATQAMKHLDTALVSVGSAGSAIHNVVDPFQTPASKQSPDNYAPASLGQLKAVAKPFYDRLIRLGVDTRQNLIDHGGPPDWPHAYPWNPASPVGENYAPANLGQLKWVFSFDATGATARTDADGDLVADAWETLVSATNPQVDNSADNSDGDGMGRALEFLAGRNATVSDSPVDASSRALDVHSSFGL